jgi:hypothetical protein
VSATPINPDARDTAVASNVRVLSRADKHLPIRSSSNDLWHCRILTKSLARRYAEQRFREGKFFLRR